ncbi:MAG: DEAD/DEAH box helicase family protein [Candidatus Berkelbacteria bacterium]|nr:DEAD/DEAH box helicase family protein [Candidatus Berkelbacteria bacterium]
MSNFSNQEKINIYKNLFRGREDIFAARWQSVDGKRAGWTPVCKNEWHKGKCQKLNHGHCQDCLYKNYLALTDIDLAKHLAGEKIYGIYPLLPDGTSNFLALDFDGKSWLADIKKFAKICREDDLPIYIEQSFSGDGAHAWFFFADAYPATKSRQIFQTLLENSGLINKFSNESAFDRIFPSQDFLDGDGIGNLISLPLQGKAKPLGKTVFLADNFSPIEDQWQFLATIEKIPTKKLEKILAGLTTTTGKRSTEKIKIEIANKLILSGKNLPSKLSAFIKSNLNFINPEYLIKRRMGVGAWGIPRMINLVESRGENLLLPRGFFDKLKNFLDEEKIKFNVKDLRQKFDPINFASTLKLFDYQKEAIEKIMTSEQGILVAPPGSGKTIIGIELIARLGQPALIIVHKKQIFDQWLERIEDFLGIPKNQIGQLGSGKKSVGKQITVAMIQTLYRLDNKKIKDKFGTIVVDECHHLPAKMFRQVIGKFNPYYLYGLTATPERKYHDENLIFIFLGQILQTIENAPVEDETDIFLDEQPKNLQLKVIETDFSVPFFVEFKNAQIVLKMLVCNTGRTEQIVGDVVSEAKTGAKCLVLTERRDQAEILTSYLKNLVDVITLTGELSERKKKERLKLVERGKFQVIVATGQLLGEGTDIKGLDSLFLVYPFSFHGKLIQYIGRITRNFSEGAKGKIFDYRDINIPYLDRIFLRRKKYYDKIGLG